jgi:hypothetical protein
MSVSRRITVWFWTTASLWLLRASGVVPVRYKKRMAMAGIDCIRRATIAAIGHRRAKWLGVE